MFAMLALTRLAMLAYIRAIAQVGLTFGLHHDSNSCDAFYMVEYKGSVKVPHDVEQVEEDMA